MKQILLALTLFLILLVPCLAQENKVVPNNNLVRYYYNVSGIVLSEKSHPLPKITVCFLTAVRPSDARVPCVKTDDKGRFSVGSYNIPDQYEVCASTTDVPFIAAGDEKNQVVCSNPLTFEAKDESKKIKLKFTKKKNLPFF